MRTARRFGYFDGAADALAAVLKAHLEHPTVPLSDVVDRCRFDLIAMATEHQLNRPDRVPTDDTAGQVADELIAIAMHPDDLRAMEIMPMAEDLVDDKPDTAAVVLQVFAITLADYGARLYGLHEYYQRLLVAEGTEWSR